MSINCKKAEEYLVEYLYQELSAKKTLEIEKHLHGCAHCTKTLESWRAIHRGYQRSPEEPQVAPYFKQKILAAAEEELFRSPSWKDRLFFALKIATVPVAIFVLLVLFNQTQNGPPNLAMKNKEAPAQEEAQRPQAVQPRPSSDDLRQKAPERLETESYSLEKLKMAQKTVPAAPGEEKRSQYSEFDAYVAKKEAELSPPSAAEPVMQNQPAMTGATRSDELQSEQAASPTPALQIASPHKTNASQLFTEGQSKLQKNETKAGVQDLKDAIKQDSKQLAGQFHQSGNMYQSQGDYANAIIQFSLLQSNYRDYELMDDVLLRLGDSYAELGQFDKALKSYSQVSAGHKKVAQDRIRQLQKKRDAQEQLKSLGYVDSDKQ